MESEARLYQQALKEAEDHLARWEELGKHLIKLLTAGWQNVLAIRQALVKQSELLIQFAEQARQ